LGLNPGKICAITIAAFLLIPAFGCRAQSPGYLKVDPDTIEERLNSYEGEDAERRITLTRIFKEAGCGGDRLQVQPVEDADAPNVICTLPGDSGDVIVVGAHFDRVDKGDGVADNWSGAALLPSLYQSLQPMERRHTFVFVGFTDEEEGYKGSAFYVRHLAKEELASIRAMIDLDTLGLETTRVWASNSDPGLVALAADVAASLKLPLDVMNVDEYGDSDGSMFKSSGIPVLTLHSVTLGTIGILHSEKDTIGAIRQDAYYDTYTLVAALLAELDARGVR